MLSAELNGVNMMNKYFDLEIFIKKALFLVVFLITNIAFSQVTLEKEVKITDLGLHFDGSKVGSTATNPSDNASYDFYFGRNISAHGDCIKTYENYVFMTWYKGGKDKRHVMLTRYNTATGVSATIEFPHRHTGYQNKYWIGESHNTIAVAVSPLDGTIHLLYDMHAYGRTRPTNGSLSKDYFRYSYSIKNAASLPDADFTLDKFVKNSSDGYKHLSLNSGRSGFPDEEYSKYAALTYPQFFTNDLGDIFMYMREGGNNNGAYKFSKYDASTSTWSNFTHFNVLNAKNQSGVDYNWGLYGNMKYVNGKIRVGFQRRSADNNDKYQYQNGVYYAYSDDQSGATDWKNPSDESFNLPLYDTDFVKVMEPGDYVTTTQANKVYIVSDFDWTVTDNGDVHIISKVKDNENNVTKSLHTYKPAGATDFITSEDFAGGTSIYTSGENVYIIGLNSSNRIFVDKAEGGTNKFSRVYEATSGRTFDHGRVHINKGKLYYYLMENKSGSAQPLYLQIIDLGIINDPFRVSITSPTNNQDINLEETLQITANAVNETGTISKIEFKINDTLFDTATSEPYSVNWSPTAEGVHKLQAVAYNEYNETVSSSEITVTVRVDNPEDLTGNIYRVKNVATGKYLTSNGSSLTLSDSGEGLASEWEFVKSGTENYFNINSRTDRGILRFAGGSAGTMINTGFAPPRTDVDKIWTVIYNEAEENYTFETRNLNRFLYQDETNGIVHSSLSDDRSKWVVESTTQTLSTKDILLSPISINVFPNPTRRQFIVQINEIDNAKIEIFDILGKLVYKQIVNSEKTQINTNNIFKSGLYLIKIEMPNKAYYRKILIK